MQTWMDRLRERMQTENRLQMSIDGQIYTVEAGRGMYTYTNEYGRQETFDSAEGLITSLQSSFEHPDILFV